MTIFEAALLVFCVVFLFLQTWRATLIPMIAVPVSLIGTFAGPVRCSASRSTRSRCSRMVLAIGIVVDDAIVVLENVERLMRENEACRRCEAAIEAMHEVSGAVIAIVLVLCAVFLPVAFLGGIAGAALPAVRGDARDLGGDLGLRRAHAHAGAVRAAAARPGTSEIAALSAPFNRGFARLTRRFLRRRGAFARACAAWSLARRVRCVIVAVVGLLPCACPRASCRPRTRATSSASIMLPDGATLQRTAQVTARSCSERRAEHPGGRSRVRRRRASTSSAAATRPTPATIFIPLKHWDERADDRAASVAARRARSRARTLRGRHGARVRSAGDPRPRHRGRLRGVRAGRATGPIRGELVRGRRRRSSGELRKHPELHRHQHVLPPDRAAAARRGRPREGDLARRAGAATCSTRCRARWARCT